MKKITLIFILILPLFMYSQNISINQIRNNISTISKQFKKSKTINEMYTISDNYGKRWIYIKNTKFDGLKSDEKVICTNFSKLIVNYLFKSLNYNLESPISYDKFIKTLYKKGFSGIEFDTKNNKFNINLSELR